MVVGILGIIIGVLVLGAGIYYLATDKENDSKKIYGTISCVGVAVAIISVIILISALK